MERPVYSKRAIERAGRSIAAYEGPYKDLAREALILETWRQAHNEIMIGVQAELLDLVRDVCQTAVVVSRLKRADAIVVKLKRRDIKHKLSTLRDIAGCRIIVDTLEELECVSNEIVERFGVAENDIKDHVAIAKDDGYRSRHFIVHRDTRQYNGLRCEIQLRTRLQHSWATAVEVYDVISSTGLKTGGGSEPERLVFKELSDLLAIRERGQECGQDGLRDSLLRVRERNESVKVLEKLKASKGSVSIMNTDRYRSNEYCLLFIDYAEQYTQIYTYDFDHADEANAKYAELERSKRQMQDVLLVSVSSMNSLREAYPNYSADIQLFIDVIDELMSSLDESHLNAD